MKHCFRILTFSALVLLTITLSSCDRSVSLEGQLVNQYGGEGRSNSYEDFPELYRSNWFLDTPVSKDTTQSDTSGIVSAPLILGTDMFIIGTFQGNIHMASRASIFWTYNLDDGTVLAARMAADRKQNIYAITTGSKVISLDIRGNLRWEYQMSPLDDIVGYSHPLVTDKGILCAMTDGQLIMLGHDGKLIWHKQCGAAISKLTAADDNGNIAYVLTNNMYGRTDTLVFADSQGNEQWRYSLKKHRMAQQPVISGDKVYSSGLLDTHSGRLTTVFCLDTMGKELWKNEIGIQIRRLSVSQKGEVICSGHNSGLGNPLSGLYCIGPDGKMKWNKFYELSITSELLITKNSISFLCTQDVSTAMLFLTHEGTPSGSVPLELAPVHRQEAQIVPESYLLLSGAEKLCFISIDDTEINKVLPY